jgi:hypothetical protein
MENTTYGINKKDAFCSDYLFNMGRYFLVTAAREYSLYASPPHRDLV